MGFPLETLPAQMGQVLPKGALESRELLGNHHALLSLDDPTVCFSKVCAKLGMLRTWPTAATSERSSDPVAVGFSAKWGEKKERERKEKAEL